MLNSYQHPKKALHCSGDIRILEGAFKVEEVNQAGLSRSSRKYGYSDHTYLGRPVTCARVTRVTCARALACHLCPRMCLNSRQGHTLGHLSRKRGPVTCARLSVLMCGRARG